MSADATPEPTREEIDQTPGLLLLEFGANWCGHCQALQPTVDALVEELPDVRYRWVEDGPGRPLGRSFRVKVWPNVVLMKDGRVVEQFARPEPGELKRAVREWASGG